MNSEDKKPLQETVPPPESGAIDPRATGAHEPSRSDPHRAGLAGEYQPQIAGYEIIERIGSGGMGTVWRAVQISTRRDVALKLVSASVFGSDRGRLRFDREVELMARLEHPNIARVYDSGIDHGAYYYAMQLIKGVPLDEYVKQHRLEQRQIIELVRSICQAVMFAHQRGVIHRDLKPSNIMITADGEPHVLDFGLAKTVFDSDAAPAVTIDGEVAGTPAFMSPEQAAGRPVDTRSDVYSLGVILYRLLCGESPHDLSGSQLQVLQRISQEEIRRPRDVADEVDRELEAVLFKALKKSPDERYASAGELAQDLDNYLAGEPLLARAPTTAYFLRKRVRKHIVPVTVASIVLLSILGMAIYSYITVSRARVRAEAARVRAEAATDFLSKMLVSADPGSGNRADIRVRDVLDKASSQIGPEVKSQPQVEAVVRTAIGHTYTVLGLYPQAEQHLRRAIELNNSLAGRDAATTLANQKDLGAVFLYTARYKEAEPLMLATYQQRLKALGENNRETADAMFNLALLYLQTQRYDESLQFGRRALAVREKLFGPESAEAASSLQYIAEVYLNTGKLSEAEELHKQSLAIREKALGPNHFEVGNSLNNLGRLYMNRGEFDKAEPLLERALAVFKVALPPDHPNTASTLDNLAAIKIQTGKFDDAAALAARAMAIKRKMYPGEHPEIARSIGLQALIEGQRGHLPRAEELFRQALASSEKSSGPNDVTTVWLTVALGGTLKDEGKFAEAIPYLRRAREAYAKTNPAQAEQVDIQVMDCLIRNKQYKEAEPMVKEFYRTARERKYPDAAARLAALGPATELMSDLHAGLGQTDEAERYAQEQRQLQAATQPAR